MLSINRNAGPYSDHREHAWALRTIGQDLADLRPEYLEVVYTGQIYIVRGRTWTDQSPAKKSRARRIFSAFRKVSKRSAGQARESQWFQRRYTIYEINRLDEQGLIQRKDRPVSPDIYVLGERLRTIGKMIEAKHGQLLRLTLDNKSVAFVYRDLKGMVYNEEHSTPALYRSQQDGNRSRGTGRTRDPWENAPRRIAPRSTTSTDRKFRLRPDDPSKR